MPFAFSQIDPQTRGEHVRWDVPLNTWLGVKFGEGLSMTIGRAWERYVEDQYAEGDLLTPDQANERYGLPTLKFSEPVVEQRAYLMHERKKDELARMAYLEAATHKWYHPKAFAGFAASLVGGFASPIDAGTIFLPIVGSANRARAMAKAGYSPVRQALARGLITEEAIANIAKFPRLTGAVIEGTIGQSIVEVPVYLQAKRDQAVYGITDSLFNIVAGGAFAGGLHLGAKALSRLLEGSAKFHQQLSPETKEAIFREHVTAFAEGRAANIRDFVEVDEAAIRARVAAELKIEERGAIKAEAAEARLSQDLDRPFDVIDAIEGYVGGKISLSNARQFIEDFQPSGAARNLFAADGRKLDDVLASLHQQGVFQRIQSDDQLIEAIARAADSRKAHREAVRAEKVKVVKEVIARKKAEFEAKKEGRVQAEVAAEISRQQAAGRILSQEQIDKYKVKPTDESASTALDQDISTLEQDLKADNDRRVTDDMTPEEKQSLQEELDAELASIKEQTYQPRDKAVDAAIPCVMEGLTNG